jgi:acetylornithine deacetylase/succinyl-diaminopimelate desuccinylase-like protein
MPAALGDRVRELLPAALDDLRRLVAIPSVANNPNYRGEDLAASAELTANLFRAAGIRDARTIELDDGTRSVIGHEAGPRGSPTVLLYAHHDVQPPGDESRWQGSPWELTERNGRWYGRGAADCKGGTIAHVLTLQVLRDALPCSVRIVVEGAEEANTGSFARFVPDHPELLEADVIVVGDSGNLHAGKPNVITSLRGIANVRVTVSTLAGSVHSGKFGGPAPDALMALIHGLAKLHDDAGSTAIPGLHAERWTGWEYAADEFRRDAGVLDGVALAGEGGVSEGLWTQPSVTVLGIDVPRVDESSASLLAEARARVSVRLAPGDDPERASSTIAGYLQSVMPWHAIVEVERETPSAPFRTDTASPAFAAAAEAFEEAYGEPLQPIGSGGAIGMVSALQRQFPDATILIWGVQDGAALIHSEHESVSPSEIERQALAQALFLQRLGRT